MDLGYYIPLYYISKLYTPNRYIVKYFQIFYSMLVTQSICLYEFDGDRIILDRTSWVYVIHHVRVKDVGKNGSWASPPMIGLHIRLD